MNSILCQPDLLWTMLTRSRSTQWLLANVLILLTSFTVTLSTLYAGSLEDGQAFIDQGQYNLAVDCFTEFIAENPTSPEGYRGRIEALLMQRRYSDAMLDVSRFNALVIPADPDAAGWILEHYETRIAADPNDTVALTGGSFAYWWNFDYATALLHLETLDNIASDDPYAVLFQGSARLLSGVEQAEGEQDFAYALLLDTFNPHARFIVADGYTYGLPKPNRAFIEAALARLGGLDTPRVNAIFAACFEAWGNMPVSSYYLRRHFDQVTSNLVVQAPLGNNKTRDVQFTPGMTVEIPVTIQAGKIFRVETSSPSGEVYDTVAVLLTTSGIPLTGSDDTDEYFAAFQWTAPVTATYKLRVTTFEAVSTGLVRIRRF